MGLDKRRKADLATGGALGGLLLEGLFDRHAGKEMAAGHDRGIVSAELLGDDGACIMTENGEIEKLFGYEGMEDDAAAAGLHSLHGGGRCCCCCC